MLTTTTTIAEHSVWLAPTNSSYREIRLLSCQYANSRLISATEITPTSNDWNCSVEQQELSVSSDSLVTLTTYRFKAKRAQESVGVAVAHDRKQWSSDNYVMIPASVYNGNRQRIVNRPYGQGLDRSDLYRKELPLTSTPIPQLSPEFGAPSRLEVNISNTTTPAITILHRDKQIGEVILTDQGIVRNGEIIDHALIAEEDPLRQNFTMVIAAPGVRERKPEFVGFSESPDRGINVSAGEEIIIRTLHYRFKSPNVPHLVQQFAKVRKALSGPNSPRNIMPRSEVLALMTRNIDRRYCVTPEWEFYCPENAEWISFGWIGGLMNTFPMLALGDEKHLNRVVQTFNFAIPRGQGESGYFYGALNKDGKVFGREGYDEAPEIVLTRKNADVLYWMIKQFDLLKRQGHSSEINPLWEKQIQKLADAFVLTYEKEGSWGNFVNNKDGRVAVFNTTGGAMAVAGLVLASNYYSEPKYLAIAKQAAEAFYKNFTCVGFTSGGCADILQNADSETAISLLTSLFTLYECTSDAKWLVRAEALAGLCATWTVSFDYQLPLTTPLGKNGAKLTGAVWASTQNKHGAPGFCTQSGDALFRLYRSTGNMLYADLIHDIIHAHVEGIHTNGNITERLTYCDADSRGAWNDGGKTGWNETNGAMMALEIPSIYLRTDIERLYCFDMVEVEIVKRQKDKIVLRITNPTPMAANLSILAEGEDASRTSLPLNAFLEWKQLKVAPGKTITYIVPIK